MIVLDTNIISELMKSFPDENVINWFGTLEPQLITITSITIAELRYGISILPHGKRREAIHMAFKEMIAEEFNNAILDFDLSAAEAYGNLAAKTRSSGITVSQSDTMIAAITSTYEATLATRNTKDFSNFGIAVVNPFSDHN